VVEQSWRFEEVSLVLAGLATPLVLSVHTIVSMDFATSVLDGTLLYSLLILLGAVFSGLRWLTPCLLL
jgi:molybdopterin-containing oxidoreductase family membrane subunit